MERGYAKIHNKIKTDEYVKAKLEGKDASKPEPEKPEPEHDNHKPAFQGKKGELATTKGSTGSKLIHYPHKTPDGSQEMRRKHIAVQKVHHWTHDGEKWNHTHTRETSAGLNGAGAGEGPKKKETLSDRINAFNRKGADAEKADKMAEQKAYAAKQAAAVKPKTP